MSKSFITPGHVRAFQMVTSRMYDNITLASCRINGEPGVVIVLVDHAGEDKIAVMPLFVAITESMELELIGLGEAADGGGEGGPRRGFAAAKEMTQPSSDPA